MLFIHELVLSRQGSARELGLDAPGDVVFVAVPPDLPPGDGAPDRAQQNADERDEDRPAVRLLDEAGRRERTVGREQCHVHTEEELVIPSTGVVRLRDGLEALLVFLEEHVSLGPGQTAFLDTE